MCCGLAPIYFFVGVPTHARCAVSTCLIPDGSISRRTIIKEDHFHHRFHNSGLLCSSDSNEFLGQFGESHLSIELDLSRVNALLQLLQFLDRQVSLFANSWLIVVTAVA